MSDYRVKPGAAQALIDLVSITPQPASSGVQPTHRAHAADGTPHDQGLYIALNWSVVANATQYDAILDYFDLADNPSATVTIYAPSPLYVYTRYQGVAVRPGGGARREFFIRNITIIVRDLIAL